jgi:hypothetical protein
MPLVHRGLEALEIRRFTRPLDRDWTRTSYTALARARPTTMPATPTGCAR